MKPAHWVVLGLAAVLAGGGCGDVSLDKLDAAYSTCQAVARRTDGSFSASFHSRRGSGDVVIQREGDVLGEVVYDFQL